MASSDQRRRLAALEAGLASGVDAATDYCRARVQALMSADAFQTLGHYNARVRDGGSPAMTSEEIAAVEQYDRIVSTDLEIMEISRMYGLPQVMLAWGKAWQTRY